MDSLFSIRRPGSQDDLTLRGPDAEVLPALVDRLERIIAQPRVRQHSGEEGTVRADTSRFGFLDVGTFTSPETDSTETLGYGYFIVSTHAPPNTPERILIGPRGEVISGRLRVWDISGSETDRTAALEEVLPEIEAALQRKEERGKLNEEREKSRSGLN